MSLHNEREDEYTASEMSSPGSSVDSVKNDQSMMTNPPEISEILLKSLISDPR